MTQTYRNNTGNVFARTCWFTALLNGLFAAHGTESLPQPPASPTRPTTPSSPVIPGNPGDDAGGKWSGNPLQYGPVDVHLRIYGGALYDDNIFTSDSNKESDFIFSIAPTVTLAMGDYRQREGNALTLDYTPSFIFYADKSDLYTVNHDANLAAQVASGPWQVRLSQGYLRLFDADVDAGNFIGKNVYSTLLSAEYEISPKTSLELNAGQRINDIGTTGAQKVSANSYNDWAVEAFADYRVTPKIKTGLGLGAGWVDNRVSTDGKYQQVLARVTYAVTEKVDLGLRAGGQLQEFEEVKGEQRDNRLNGIFSASAAYRPVERTALALSAYREDRSSIVLINKAYTVSGVDLSVRQAVTDRLSAGLSGGYSFSDYYATDSNANGDRQDNYWRVQVSVDWQVVEQFSVGAFYQYRVDDSSGGNASDFSFRNNQVGLNVIYRF